MRRQSHFHTLMQDETISLSLITSRPGHQLPEQGRFEPSPGTNSPVPLSTHVFTKSEVRGRNAHSCDRHPEKRFASSRCSARSVELTLTSPRHVLHPDETDKPPPKRLQINGSNLRDERSAARLNGTKPRSTLTSWRQPPSPASQRVLTGLVARARALTARAACGFERRSGGARVHSVNFGFRAGGASRGAAWRGVAIKEMGRRVEG